MSTATSTFNEKATDDNFYTSKDGQSCVSLLSVVCGYPSVSPVMRSTENTSKVTKMRHLYLRKVLFTAKALKRQAPVLTNRVRGKDVFQNEISGDNSFQSKITLGVGQFRN